MAATAQTLSLTAMEEASRRGQREADIDDLFLALVVDEQLAGQVLRWVGITLDAAREAVAAQHAAQLESIGITADLPDPDRIVFHETGGYEWTRRALDIFDRASQKGNQGDGAAVLRALLAEPSGMIEALLHRLDTAPAEVLARLDEAEQLPARPAPRDPAAGALSGSTEKFIPAPVPNVWAMLADPARMPEWEPGIDSVDPGEETGRFGDTWMAQAPTHRPDGKPLNIRPEFQRRQVELLGADQDSHIAWRHTYPDATRANPRCITITLEPAAGGTQLGITLEWERIPKRRILDPLLRPWHKFAVWMQLTQIGAVISRAFR
jgi:uncharacterized protein YndB with AHSA1/START domain